MKARHLLLCAALAASPARADGQRFTAAHPAWQAECGACHVAYPPQLLSADAWRRIMARLDRHFGSDASLDAKAAADIESFLTAYAGSRRARAATTAPDDAPRITETPWFRKEHREVAPALWTSTEVKSAANCAACHLRAEQGDYAERSLRLPRGGAR